MMSTLKVTLIDVGWGDSILIESEDSHSNLSYGLIDSNDTTTLRSSYIFVKRYLEHKGIKTDDEKPIFSFVLLTHAHADHGQGLKAILRAFGTKNFWYPKSLNWSSMVDLIRFAGQSPAVEHHQSVDETKILPSLGEVNMQVLWPPYNQIDKNSENNNSVVLSLGLGNVSFILAGDAEEGVWNQIASRIPVNTQFFKVPHHGSKNGTFDAQNNTSWFNHCPQNAKLGISSHIRPFNHPDQEVVRLFESNQREYFRTDEHYHITFTTDGNTTHVKYSHLV
jgi:competence protein ComEC